MGTVSSVEQPCVPAPAPRSAGELFAVFTWVSLQGFGGVMAIAQDHIVERRRWMSRDDFVEMLAVAQVLPGPNIVNLALMFGDRCFGLRGACCALAGMLLVPLVLVLVLAALYARFSSDPLVAGALRGMGAVAAGLVIATALKLGGTLRRNPMGLPAALGLAALTFVAVGMLHWPLLWIVGGLGPPAVAIAWIRLGRRPR